MENAAGIIGYIHCMQIPPSLPALNMNGLIQKLAHFLYITLMIRFVTAQASIISI